MVGADVVRAAVVLVLPWVSEIWQVFVLVGVLQVASATFTPVFQSVIPDVVPDEQDYAGALSAAQLASSAETVLSPLLAAAAVVVTSYSTLFVGTCAGFVLSAVLVASTVVPPVAGRAQGDFATRLLLGAGCSGRSRSCGAAGAERRRRRGGGGVTGDDGERRPRPARGTEADVGLLLAVSGAGTARRR